LNSRSRKSAPKPAARKSSRETFRDQWREFLRRNMNWFLITGLALLILQDVFGTHGVLAMRRSIKEAQQVQQEIDRLNTENQKLQDHVQSLKSDPAAIEKIAREDMGLARPGEYIFKIPPKSSDPAAGNPAPATSGASSQSQKKR
jgi:cell division protein FtsB